MNVLFVCIGNTCRSPMAEALLIKKLKALKIKNVSVRSCGTRATEGKHANPLAVQVLKENGLKPTGYGASRLSSINYNWADKAYFFTDVPEWCNDGKSCEFPAIYGLSAVADPYGGTIEDYRVAFKAIDAACDILASEIKKELSL